MTSLGFHDPGVGAGALEAFFERVARHAGDAAGERKLLGDKGRVSLKPLPDDAPMQVSEIQAAMRDAGFLPGGRVDGIFGYRTRAAVRLFQEHVRSIEHRRCLPDGVVGSKTARHVRRWSDDGLQASWMPTLDAFSDGTLPRRSCEFNDWLAFLEELKSHYRASPSPLLRRVNGFDRKTDTRRVARWNFSPAQVQLVGIRNAGEEARPKFDDVLVLLLGGLVFKFQGSTDPGHTRNPKGAPFLVPGQHDFRIGLHRGSYHALRPASHGVLVVRSKDDILLDEEDLRGRLERNATINIHWGGKGVGRPVNRWSEGCQVIAGSGYENHENDLVSCAGYVGINNTEVKQDSQKTRGAYNVLADLIVALSSELRNPSLVRYTLLRGEDLALEPKLERIVASTRSRARGFMAKLA